MFHHPRLKPEGVWRFVLLSHFVYLSVSVLKGMFVWVVRLCECDMRML